MADWTGIAWAVVMCGAMGAVAYGGGYIRAEKRGEQAAKTAYEKGYRDNWDEIVKSRAEQSEQSQQAARALRKRIDEEPMPTPEQWASLHEVRIVTYQKGARREEAGIICADSKHSLGILVSDQDGVTRTGDGLYWELATRWYVSEKSGNAHPPSKGNCVRAIFKTKDAAEVYAMQVIARQYDGFFNGVEGEPLDPRIEWVIASPPVGPVPKAAQP